MLYRNNFCVVHVVMIEIIVISVKASSQWKVTLLPQKKQPQTIYDTGRYLNCDGRVCVYELLIWFLVNYYHIH